MAFSRERILGALARLPFVDAGELAIILGEPLATVHRALMTLRQDSLVQRVSHGTAHLPSSHRYYLTGNGIAAALGFDAPSVSSNGFDFQNGCFTCRARPDCLTWRWQERTPDDKVPVTFSGEATVIGKNA